MAMAHSNRLLPLLAAIVLIVTVLVVVKSCTGQERRPSVMTSVPQLATPDADTPADTINTLTANVSAMRAALANLRQDNAGLKQENQALANQQQQIETAIEKRLQQKVDSKVREGEQRGVLTRQQDTVRMDALAAELDALTQRLAQVSSQTLRSPSAADNSPANATDIPVGIGLDELIPAPPINEELIWIEPLEQSAAPKAKTGGLLDRIDDAALTRWGGAGQSPRAAIAPQTTKAEAVIPVYTIPRNATLVGATAMTALVGRVPVQGQVRDPMPFKVITGRENLAANGLRIPGVQGMIWSGTAVGDWTLSCVSGQLESVTFVFDDGTIQTLSSDDRSAQPSGRNTQKPLGWISDTRGIPCVSGDRKTNAPAFLSQRLGVALVEAAAEAAAQAETTTLIGEGATSSRQVTGDLGQYLAGKTLSGGSQEIADWLQQRQAQSFDAVFVPAGVTLAIHVDHELPIDFQSKARKLHYADSLYPRSNKVNAAHLD